MPRPLCHLLPFSLWLMLLAVIWYYHRDVPYHDQWDLLPLLDAYYRGTLGWHELLVPHNGHVLFFPQALMLLLATLTHWHTFAEVLASLLLGAANFMLLRSLLQGPGQTLPLWQQLSLAVPCFSLAQADNWLWGWQLQVPMALAAALAGLLALARFQHHASALIAAMLCGLVASGSFGAGMVFWLAALPLVFQRQRWLVLPWLVATLLLVLVYLHLLGHMVPVPHDDQQLAQQDYAGLASGLAMNFFTCLGNLAGRYHPLAATTAGAVGLALMLSLLRSHASPARAALASLMLLGTGAALLVALTRSAMGHDQMLASRYATLSLPFWAVLLSCVQQNTALARPVGILLLATLLTASGYSLKDIQRLHHRLVRGETALASPTSEEGSKALRVINPRQDPGHALAEVAMMSRYHLGYFRDHASQ